MILQKPHLSVCVDDFRVELKAGLELARKLEFRAVDVGAAAGPVSPEELSNSGRRHLLRHLADLGLRLGSLRGPVGGRGYSDGATGEKRLDTMRKCIRLAADLHAPVVSTQLGVVGVDEAQAQRVQEVLLLLADDADRAGVTVAVETSGLRAAELAELLKSISCPNLAACCDSGAMLMEGDDPHHVDQTLPGRIKLVRGRDAMAGSRDAPGREASWGDGQLDPPLFLASLVRAGFEGDIVLSRTQAARPADELRQARESLERLLR